MNVIRPFGPIIGKDELPTDIHQKLIDLTDNILEDPNREDMGNQLAGHIKDQYRIPIKQLDEEIYYYFLDCVHNYTELCVPPDISYPVQFGFTDLWVNNMVKHEWNPPHIHNEDLSAIVVLKLPADLDEDKYEGMLSFINNSSRTLHEFESGNLSLSPKEKDFYLFPARLNHAVTPFTCEGIRRTISFNVKTKIGKSLHEDD